MDSFHHQAEAQKRSTKKVELSDRLGRPITHLAQLLGQERTSDAVSEDVYLGRRAVSCAFKSAAVCRCNSMAC